MLSGYPLFRRMELMCSRSCWSLRLEQIIDAQSTSVSIKLVFRFVGIFNLYTYYSILVFFSFQRRFMKREDENIQFKTALFKATHFSKSGNDSFDAIKSYFEILYH